MGAIAVAWARTALSERLPSAWTYFEGLLFVLPVAFLPGGLASLVSLVRFSSVRRRRVKAES
jgi:urea transport system permease protein